MKYAITLLIFIAMVMLSPAYAADTAPAVALSGYDVVSYFTKGKAEKGSAQHSHIYKGAEYHFSSDEQKAMFIASPEKYLPQYDGYCAYGVTVGRKLEASPEAWKIVNGKLYLNLNKDFLADWSKNADQSIAEGDDQWELIKDIPASEL